MEKETGGDPVTFQVEQFRERLTELRLQKSVSESKMSYELGQCKGYIQQISSGRSLPFMERFLSICDYLDISPSEFFDVDNQTPELIRELASAAKRLKADKIRLLIDVANGFQGE